VTILFFADPFYRQGIVTNQAEPTHFIAGGVAVFLMLFALLLVLAGRRVHRAVVLGSLALMAAVYLTGATAVARLGSPGSPEGIATLGPPTYSVFSSHLGTGRYGLQG
jgi:hypothetical protein